MILALETGNWIAIIGIIVTTFVTLLVYLLQKRDTPTEGQITRPAQELSERILTSSPRAATANDVIGRNKDLKKLWAMLSDKKHVMLTGFGGIGKTRLAQLLFHEHENEFDEVAWIDYQGNLKKSLMACIKAKQFDIENKTEDELWELMEHTLNNDGGKKKLFIVDNVDSEKGQHPEKDTGLQQLISLNNTTVLLTSRMKGLEDFHTFELGYLSKKDCIALFNLYYQGKDADPNLVDSLVELAGMHTLTIEILAKGARQENLKNYYKKVKSGFDKVDKKVTTKGDKKEDTIERHLQCLFNLKRRRRREKKVLHGFAVLPVNCECTEKELLDWFGFKKSYWTALVQDGWLIYDSNHNTYSLHPLLRTITRFDFKEDHTICPSGVAKKMLKFLEKDVEWYNVSNGYESLQRMAGIVVSVMDTANQKKNKQFATIYHRLGFLYCTLGNYGKALEYYQKALAIREKVLGTEHPDTATSYNNIGTVYDDQGDYGKALEYYQKTLEIFKKVLGTEHPDTAISYNNIGLVYKNQGDYGKALEYYQKALAIDEKVLGKEHHGTAIDYNNIGAVYDTQGDYDKALEYYQKAMEIKEKVLGTEHSGTATSYNNIGLAYKEQGDYDNALEYYQKALAIDEKVLGKEHHGTAIDYNNIGAVYKAQGDYGKALEYLQKALEIRENVLGTEHPLTATSYNNIGVVYYEMKEYPKALEYLGKAFIIRISILGDEHPYTKGTFKGILQTLIDMGKNEDEIKEFFQRLFGK